jgi:predicted lipoprotein
MKHSYINIVFLSILLLGSLLLSSCKEKTNPAPVQEESFSKRAMLESFADKIILPNLAILKLSVSGFSQATETFIQSPTQSSLDQLRARWDSSYVDFLHCNAFNYGPGEVPITGMFAENIGIWPVNTTKLEQRITQKNFNFNDFERDTRGFQAVEYLLFSPDALTRFQDTLTGADRKAYLQALVQHISGWVNTVHDGWGTYRQTFVQNDGKDAGSSVSMLYNDFLESFEAIKNFKIGVPAGVRAGQTQPEPGKTESYYSGNSTRHLKEHFKAIEYMWKGNSRSGQEGIGFDDWLNSLQDGKTLLSETRTRFDELQALNQSFNDSQSIAAYLQSDLNRVQNWYTEYQKFTRYIKSDLSSLIGIAITYSSGDGD